MKTKTFVIWSDWDGVYVKSFNEGDLEANTFIMGLNEKAASVDNYGTQIIAVITGKSFYSIKETK